MAARQEGLTAAIFPNGFVNHHLAVVLFGDVSDNDVGVACAMADGAVCDRLELVLAPRHQHQPRSLLRILVCDVLPSSP